jgi:hypothetical protein
MERTVPAIVRCANGARPPGSGDRGKEEAQRQIGGFLGQDAGRVGDDNATGKGGIDINIVIAHAKTGDDFGLGQMVEQVFAHPTVQCRGGNSTNSRPNFAQECFFVRSLPQVMGGKSIAQLGNDQGHHWGGNQYIFILHGFSHGTPRRNAMDSSRLQHEILFCS